MTREKSVDDQLAGLGQLDLTSLRGEWIRLYGKPPSRYVGRELLMRAVAYRIQEKAYGGLKPAIVRKLRKVMEDLRAGKKANITPPRIMQPGVRLMREWNGETHVVEVQAKGFAWRGKHYPSLSAVAQAITGTRWSGPRFFGLLNKQDCSAKSPAGSGR